MTVYIDNEQIRWRGKRWCHLVADSLEELHSFAAAIGLKRDWFQDRASYPHYDVTITVRERAIELGAICAGKTQMLMCARQLKAEVARGERGHDAVPGDANAAKVSAPAAGQVTMPLF